MLCRIADNCEDGQASRLEPSLMDTIMTERVNIPPPYCASLCANAMSEICIEQCAISRDCSGFKLKRGVDLPSMPRFPLDQFLGSMTADERKTIMAVYTAKTIDHLQGYKDEPSIITRPHLDSERSSR